MIQKAFREREGERKLESRCEKIYEVDTKRKKEKERERWGEGLRKIGKGRALYIRSKNDRENYNKGQ